jgi:glycosyltransferase involved in cell wall biosynthesis
VNVLYISNGNLPSRWAHTFQVVRMAEALDAVTGTCELVTARGLLPGAIERVDLGAWYGAAPSLRVVRLPIALRASGECFTFTQDSRFDALASLYARWRRPDLVFTRSLGAAWRCAAHALATVLECHLPGDAPQLAKLRAMAGLPGLRAFVTVNETLRREWVASGIPDAKIRVWPDAVDLERFRELPAPPAARARLGIGCTGPLVVYCGHLYPEKGADTLALAAAHLPKATVMLVGGWPDDVARLRERARGAENLRLVGFVPGPQVPGYLAAADVLVLPNSGRFEQARITSPLKLFEYMAARRPIVATRIPALEGLLAHGRNAWLVAPDSEEALAEGIERVLGDPELGARLAEQAGRDVARYTWRRRAEELLAGLVP